MHSHPVGLHVWCLVEPFIYFHTSCVRTAKALARLCGCAGSPQPSLVAYVILPYFMCANSEGSGETARMRRLAWVFAGRLHVCDKYHDLMSWLNFAFWFTLPFVRLNSEEDCDLWFWHSLGIFSLFSCNAPLTRIHMLWCFPRFNVKKKKQTSVTQE